MLISGTGERPEDLQKVEMGSIPEIDAGTYPRPHARVLAWRVEAVGRELDCPVATERSNGAVRTMRNR